MTFGDTINFDDNVQATPSRIVIQETPPVADHALAEKPQLLSVADAKAMDVGTMRQLFADHINPGQLHFMKLLGFDRIKIERAEGMYYYDQTGRPILDFFGGFGSLALGHNHPRLLATRKAFQDEQRHEIAIAFMSQYAAALAHNIAAMSPDDLDMVFLGTSGSEVMEAALKLAERAAGPARNKTLYATNSFHGKTMGVLSVTDGELYRGEFELGRNVSTVPFGDIEAIEIAFKADPTIGTIVLETVQGGGGIVIADAAFWQKLRALCDAYEVIWIADEVQCGYGRTGKFYAFEHYNVVPDITALAKSLGGGKAAVGAMVARRDIYMKAYGTPKTALIHAQATFGGMGEASVTALEALNILVEDELVENSAYIGSYLKSELLRLKAKHSKMIKDIRGEGLMIGLEFHDVSQTLPAIVRPIVEKLDDKLKGSLCGFVGSLLLREHGVLVAFTEYNRNVVRLEPPLICERHHVDQFIAALDHVLSKGLIRIVLDFVQNQVNSKPAKASA